MGFWELYLKIFKMRGEIISIISEGAEDQGVLKTIFRAFGFDGSEIRLIRPGLRKDATDNHQTIGTFQGVKNSCLGKDGKRTDFDNAFSILGCKTIVIQIDTAEIDVQDFRFTRPNRVNNPNYCTELRELVIDTINNWLEGNYQENLLYAISIEEIESWCLTYYERRNTADIFDSKAKLHKHLAKNNITYAKLKLDAKKDKLRFFESFTQLNKFHKINQLKRFAVFNQSFNDFITSVEVKFIDIPN